MKINELLSDEFRIDTPYLPGEKGCRFTWILTEDEEKTLYVRHEDLMELDELLSHGSTGKIEMKMVQVQYLLTLTQLTFFLQDKKL